MVYHSVTYYKPMGQTCFALEHCYYSTGRCCLFVINIRELTYMQKYISKNLMIIVQ